MPHGVTERDHGLTLSIQAANRQQGDLKIKLDSCLHNHLLHVNPSSRLGLGPGFGTIRCTGESRLSFTRGGHDGLHEAGVAQFFGRGRHLGFGLSKPIPGGGQLQFLSRQPTNALSVHGQKSSLCRRNDLQTGLLQFNQHWCGNGLDLRNDPMRLFSFNQLSQRLGIRHVDHHGLVGHLMAGCILVTIHCNHLNTEALKGNDHLFA